MIPSEEAIAREMAAFPGLRRDQAIHRIWDRQKIQERKRYGR